MIDTKAHWRRRALKAEAELETMKRIRAFDHSQEFELARVNATLTNAFSEIENVIDWVRNSDKLQEVLK